MIEYRFIAFTLYIRGMDVRHIGEGDGMGEEEYMGKRKGMVWKRLGRI